MTDTPIADAEIVEDAVADAPANAPVVDLLYGVSRIAAFLGLTERAVYHLAESKRIPTFKIGTKVCARRSTLLSALEALEAEAGVY